MTPNHGLSEQTISFLAHGYLWLPLVLAVVAGVSLLLLALRNKLSGGAALALGALGAVVVVGLLFMARAHGDVAAMKELPHGMSAACVGIAAMGYIVLPLFLGAAAALSLLVLALRGGLTGGAAAGLGGLGGVVVLGTLCTMAHHMPQKTTEAPKAAVATEALTAFKAECKVKCTELTQQVNDATDAGETAQKHAVMLEQVLEVLQNRVREAETKLEALTKAAAQAAQGGAAEVLPPLKPAPVLKSDAVPAPPPVVKPEPTPEPSPAGQPQ